MPVESKNIPSAVGGKSDASELPPDRPPEMTERARTEFGDAFNPDTGRVKVWAFDRRKWIWVNAVDAREMLYGHHNKSKDWKPSASLDRPEGDEGKPRPKSSKPLVTQGTPLGEL